MTVSPRKKMSIIGTRSLRGGKVTINEEDFLAGGSLSFKDLPAPSRGGAIKKKVSPIAIKKKVSPIAIKKKVSPIAIKKKVSPSAIKKKVSPSAITKKVSPKTKARRTSTLLKRLELPDEPSKLSPIMARRTRRKSMACLSTHKTEVTETVKISRSISDKALPARGKPGPKPSNKASAKPPVSKHLPPKVPASKSSAAKNPSKSASPTAPKETSPKNIKKTEVSTKVTVKSGNTTKITRTTSKTEKKSVSPTAPKETSPKNKKNEDSKVAVKAAKTTKITKTITKTKEKSASPEITKPKEVTFSPIKFYSSPKKTVTPTKRKSFTMSVDKDVSFNYSPVANKKRKFDGTPTPEASSETKLKKQMIEKSSAKKSKLPKLEKKDKATKDTPKLTKSPKITRSKAVVKTLKLVSPVKSPKQSPKSIKKSEVIVSKTDVKSSPEMKKPTTNTANKKTPETKTPAPKSDKKKSVKKTPESIVSIESRKSIKSSAKKQTTSPKVSQKKKLQGSVSKTTKKVKISADSPDGAAVEYRKTPKSDKHKDSDAVPDIGASPELKPAVDLLASIRSSPIISKVKLKPYTPKPDPTPSRVLKQTMKRKANKDLHLHAIKMKAAAKMIEPSKLVDSEIVVMKTPVQLTRTPLRKTAPVSPETPSSASNLPPTPTSSRKTLSIKRSRSVARRELLTRPSPPRSSTPIEGDSSLEPQIADPDVTDINDEIVVVKEISAEVTATQILTTEVTSTSTSTSDENDNGGVEKDDNGVVTTIISEDNVSESTDLNGSVLVKSSQDDDPQRKSNWRYCSVM